jgi:hypothetical protein
MNIIFSRYSRRRLTCLIAILICGAAGTARSEQPTEIERVLIESSRPYDRVTAAVRALGGRVTHEYKYVGAIAADVPVAGMDALRTQIGPQAIHKDVLIPVLPLNGGHRFGSPSATGASSDETTAGSPLPPSSIPAYALTHPGAYVLNFGGTRVDRVQAAGFTGAGVIVAVIDSGIRPQFTALGDSIIGGEDFVGDGLGFSNVRNEPHGTFVAGLISNNASFKLKGQIKKAITVYAPEALDQGSLTLLGAAPEARIYALRIFGVDATTGGASLSRALTAMERVIELRTAYDFDGSGVNITVCNMSWGVTTLDAGNNLLERAADAMLAAGIVPIASGGDAGSATLTISNPASSPSALAVGASSAAVHERIGSELENNKAGFGAQFRPFSGTQTGWFSSRGPNADGRVAPSLLANGVYNFSQGYCPNLSQWNCPDSVSLNTGTSFSAPIASGIAALLREAAPGASAIQILNAMAMTARASEIQDDSGTLDRGAGLVDAFGAYQMLIAGNAPDKLPKNPQPSSDVRLNVTKNTDLQIYSGPVTKTFSGLLPGERADLLLDVLPGTTQVTVNVTAITPALPPAAQNSLYGDGLFIAVHSAKTSAINAVGDYLVSELPRLPQTYVITNPDTGLLRVSLNGDTVNAGAISTTVTITPTRVTLPDATATGTIHHGETISLPLTIPPGTGRVDFLLSWDGDWAHYPTNDVDLTLIPPAGGTPNRLGETLAGPERVSILSPAAGNWTMQVLGFNVPTGQDHFTLRVLLDGVLVK